MAKYCYHASHEQFLPSQLVSLCRQAEAHRFDAAFCSDHLQPWAEIQGNSGHLWSWLGAAMQATNHIAFSTITVPGGTRHHPVMVAQAIATLAEMFPGRLPWIALGTGEALNEAALGGDWPAVTERRRRLAQAVGVIRRLLSGESVTEQGPFELHDARIWVRCQQVPELVGAAMTEATARWVGGWADGLLTLGTDLDKLSKIIDAFRQGGGEGKPVHVKVDTCFGESRQSALGEAHRHWRFTCVERRKHHDLRTPEAFEAESRVLRMNDMARHVFVWTDAKDLITHLWACVQMGVSTMDLHHVGLGQQEFIRIVGTSVIPALRLRERSVVSDR